jgi:hypothetical protein
MAMSRGNKKLIHIKEYSEDEVREIKAGLEDAGFKKELPDYVPWEDFFEEIMDIPDYMDISGPVSEMSIDALIEEFKERVEKTPEKHRDAAYKAIAELWKEKIDNELKR